MLTARGGARRLILVRVGGMNDVSGRTEVVGSRSQPQRVMEEQDLGLSDA
jgi:hypothetical protein